MKIYIEPGVVLLTLNEKQTTNIFLQVMLRGACYNLINN